ncbi:hypothetical protein DPMN_090128 [Dreissena polymorpha]|uniref:Secreted protein n=1 Tax=Dreissena polymorpha TaxID=45954 RepID=A0A9D4QYR5_DREPO|nr:hypothetical protein DPMN_090128 [Dreissena polymorpha]
MIPNIVTGCLIVIVNSIISCTPSLKKATEMQIFGPGAYQDLAYKRPTTEGYDFLSLIICTHKNRHEQQPGMPHMGKYTAKLISHWRRKGSSPASTGRTQEHFLVHAFAVTNHHQAEIKEQAHHNEPLH